MNEGIIYSIIAMILTCFGLMQSIRDNKTILSSFFSFCIGIDFTIIILNLTGRII